MLKIKNYIILVPSAAMLVLLSNFACADNFQDGIKAYQSGNYSYAEIYFKNAYRQNPNDDNIKYYLAISYVQNKKISEAKSLYKSIISTSSDQDVLTLAKAGLKLLGESYIASSSPQQVTKAILSVNSVGNILIVDNVNLNDALKVKYIFDTGASYTTISSALAYKLGISTDNAPKIKIMTGSGYIESPKVTIKKIEINGLIAYNVEALVADLPMHTANTAGDIAGLLGLSFLKDFKFTVDKKHSQIVLEK